MKLIAIGDIHGCLAQLATILERVRALGDVCPVFLGDYVDIGRDSRGVIDCLVRFQLEYPNAVFLTGNHELEMLKFIETGDFVRYAKRGGLATIRSYCGIVSGDVYGAFVRAVPHEHLQFLRTLKIFVEIDEYLFSHAGFDPARPLLRSVDALVTDTHDLNQLAKGLDGNTIVCGHYFQSDFRPILLPGFIGVDTGCGVLGGPLTGVCLPSREVIQVDALPGLTFGGAGPK